MPSGPLLPRGGPSAPSPSPGRSRGQSHFWKPVSLNKLISGNQFFFLINGDREWKAGPVCIFSSGSSRSEGTSRFAPGSRAGWGIDLGPDCAAPRSLCSCGQVLPVSRSQAPLPPGWSGPMSDLGAGHQGLQPPVPTSPCQTQGSRRGGAGRGRTDPWLPSLPPSHGVELPPLVPPGPSAGGRQSPGQVCSRHSETLSSAQISGTGSQQVTSCVLFPPQVGDSLQPAPHPPPPHYRGRGSAPAAARSWAAAWRRALC